MTGFTDQEDADYRSGNIGHAVDMIFRELKSAPEGDLDPRIVRHLNRLTNHPAVIATLGDRLLPELPEWVDRYGGERVAGGGWSARLMDSDHTRMTPKCTGPTIAAAIRAAVGKAEESDAQ